MTFPWIYFLKENEQLIIKTLTGRYVVNGPGSHIGRPFENVRRREGILLGAAEYIRVRNILSGEVRNVIGPQLYFSEANEEVSEKQRAIPLQKNEYVRILNTETGVIRVERGEQIVYLEHTEKLQGKVDTGVNIDEQTAIIVRDIETGQLDLITEPQVFIPSPQQELVDIRSRIRLENHETVVIKDKNGKFTFRNGKDGERSFFLDAYSEMLQFNWSTGVHKDKRSLRLSKLDSRPKFMWYEFEARTQDNVELVLGITIFWQITDVESMIQTTDDTPGDICSHARSAIIQSVSQVSLETFLASFNTNVRGAVLKSDDPFYIDRGVKLHSVEVRSVYCKDTETQKVLQEIIRETTNRLNRLQKQDSENEIKLKRLGGEIESEELKKSLLEIQRENVETAARIEGEAEAIQVKAFFEGLGDQVSAKDAIAIYNTLRKRDMLSKLSEGDAQLFFTPADVDLSIESRQNRK